jgi:hypothetical protein
LEAHLHPCGDGHAAGERLLGGREGIQLLRERGRRAASDIRNADSTTVARRTARRSRRRRRRALLVGGLVMGSREVAASLTHQVPTGCRRERPETLISV